MKLALVPMYSGRDNGWRAVRYDVVDLSTFFRCLPLTEEDAMYPNEDRRPEPIVEARFLKHSGYEGYRMPLSEFRRLMGTDLAPSFD